MDVLREREVKDNLERQLLDEQKMRGEYYLTIAGFTYNQHLYLAQDSVTTKYSYPLKYVETVDNKQGIP